MKLELPGLIAGWSGTLMEPLAHASVAIVSTYTYRASLGRFSSILLGSSKYRTLRITLSL